MHAFSFALAFALIPGMSNQDATPTITLNPAPPTAGQTAEVGWTGTGPKTLQLTWDPAGAGPAEIVVPKGGTAKLSIPGNAAGLVIHDPTPGGADDFATPIFP